MKPNAIKGPLIAAMVVLISWSATAAGAGILYNQPYDGNGFATVSQIFPPGDFTAGSTLSFDDFNVTSPGWNVQGVTVYGLEQADPTQNQGIFLQIQSTSLPSFSPTTGPVYSGSEDMNPSSPTYGDLFFTGLNVSLTPGTYWLTAWVVRPVAGGNWLWYFTDYGNPNGSEFLIQNPGGAFPANPGFTTLVGGSDFFGTAPSDLAFTITGSLVPEPSSVVLLGIGALCLGACAWRRRTLLHQRKPRPDTHDR